VVLEPCVVLEPQFRQMNVTSGNPTAAFREQAEEYWVSIKSTICLSRWAALPKEHPEP
jgi:hypothetical protein